MNIFSELTPVGFRSDLTVFELRQLHAAIGLPWWCFLAPSWIVRRRLDSLFQSANAESLNPSLTAEESANEKEGNV